MKKRKANIPKAVALGVGSALFLDGVLVYGPQVDRVHHWQIGAALLILGAFL